MILTSSTVVVIVVAKTRSKFVRLALLSGLVSQDQIDLAINAVRSDGGRGALPAVAVGDEALARKMVEMELSR